MKKLLLILVIAFALSGCALVEAQKANWDACMADPGCKAQAELAMTKGGAIGTLVGALTGPAGATGGGVLGGGLGGLLTALYLGAKLKKKKEEENAKTTQ